MQRLSCERIELELAKADEVRNPPVPVWAWLTREAREVAGHLLGWADDPNGAVEGRCGLVRAVGKIECGYWAEYLCWVRAEHIRQRRDL